MKIRADDLVEVRSSDEIFNSQDERGPPCIVLDGVPAPVPDARRSETT
jgi:hypothetical protein